MGKGTHDRKKERKELQLVKERRKKEGNECRRGKREKLQNRGGGALLLFGRRAFLFNAFRGTFLRLFLFIPGDLGKERRLNNAAGEVCSSSSLASRTRQGNAKRTTSPKTV